MEADGLMVYKKRNLLCFQFDGAALCLYFLRQAATKQYRFSPQM